MIGTVVVQGQVTELLDLDEIIQIGESCVVCANSHPQQVEA